MNYHQFKEAIMIELKGYLPHRYEEWKLELREVPKVNGYMDGINLLPKEGSGATPTIYVEDLYDYYQKCESMAKVCQKAASIFVVGVDYASYIDTVTSMELPKQQIVYCLVNAEKNRRVLENAPHRITLDMALIYRVVLFHDHDGINSTIITDDVAEHMGLTEEELYQLAEENTPKVLPATIHCQDDSFAVMTNQYKVLGSTVMLYPGELKSIADRLDSDLFILPSSIHEVFLIPANGQRISDMNRTMIEANNTLVPPEDVLAYHVYFYDRDRDMIGIPVELPECFEDPAR